MNQKGAKFNSSILLSRISIFSSRREIHQDGRIDQTLLSTSALPRTYLAELLDVAATNFYRQFSRVPVQIRRIALIQSSIVFLTLALTGCGGGSGGGGSSPSPVTNHTVTLTWTPNHETGVNSVRGGYQASISGQPTINVPYAGGPMAPSTTVTTLQTGTYTVTIRAFAALDAQGGSAGSFSAPSQSLIVVVP